MTFKTRDEPIMVILVDDHPVVREGYRRLLESTTDIHVVAEAGSGEAGYFQYQKHKPDVVILDINMPGIGGLETIRRIKAQDSDARILVFSMHTNETLIQRALKAGALGYITKQCGAKQMIQAIQQLMRGQVYIDPELASGIVANLTKSTYEDPLKALSMREFQVFKLIVEGSSSAQVAKILSISPKTAGVHQTNIMKKLKLQNVTQLIFLAINCNIIQSNTLYTQ